MVNEDVCVPVIYNPTLDYEFNSLNRYFTDGDTMKVEIVQGDFQAATLYAKQ